MIILDRVSKLISFRWILLLSVLLVCTQGVKLHVHSQGHPDNYPSQYNSMELMDDHIHEHIHDHIHVSKAHLSSDSTHGDYHDNVLSESETNPGGLIAKLQAKLSLPALISVLAVILWLGTFCYERIRNRHKNSVKPWRYFNLTPPLRAPPSLF